MYLPFIYKTPIILCLSKIATLNITFYILTILTCTFKKTGKWFFYNSNFLESTFNERFLHNKDNSFPL